MWVVTELKENKSSFSSTIIYCRSLSSCGQTRTGWFSQWYVHNVSFKAKLLHFQVHIRHCFWIPQNFACSFWQVECKIFYSLCKCTTQNRLLWSWGILDTNLKSNKGDMISYLIIRNYAQLFYINHLTLISSLLMSGLFSQMFSLGAEPVYLGNEFSFSSSYSRGNQLMSSCALQQLLANKTVLVQFFSRFICIEIWDDTNPFCTPILLAVFCKSLDAGCGFMIL